MEGEQFANILDLGQDHLPLTAVFLVDYCSCVIYKVRKDLLLNLVFLLHTYIHLHLKFNNEFFRSVNNLQ